MNPLDELHQLDEQLRQLSADLPRPAALGDAGLDMETRQRSHLAALDQHLRLLEPIIATLRQAQFAAEARLRLTDHTLSETIRPVINALSRPSEAVTVHLVVLQLPSTEQRISVPGLWCAGLAEGPVLAYSAAGGLEEHAGLDALRIEFAERLDDASQARPTLARMPKTDRQQAADATGLLLMPLRSRSLFAHEAVEGLRLLRKAVLAVWRRLKANRPTLIEQIDEQMAPALDLTSLLGSQPRLLTRYAALMAQRMPDWMKRTSIQGLTHLVQTMQEVALAHQQAAAPGLLTLEQFHRKQDLLWFARRELRFAVEFGFARRIDPDRVFVTLATGEPQGPIAIPFPPHSQIPGWLKPRLDKAVAIKTTRFSLTELSLENVGRFDLRFWLTARIHDAQRRPITWMTPAQIKHLVRRLNIGGSYEQFLRHHLLDSPAGQWREEAHARILRARMRAEAAKARYNGELDETGYLWAMAIIDQPDPDLRGLVLGHTLKVSQVQLNRSTLQGVLVISTRRDSALARRLLYLPDSPLRRPWQMCANNQELAARLLQEPGLHTYVLQRLPPNDRNTMGRQLATRQAGRLMTLEPIPSPLFEALYRSDARFWIAHTRAVATSTHRINRQTAWQGALLLVEMMSLLLPHRALAPLTLGRCFWSVWEGLEGLPDSDIETTLRHFAEALNHGTAAIGPMTSGNRVIRRALRQGRPPSVLSINATAAATDIQWNVRYRLEDDRTVEEAPDTDDGVKQYYIDGPHQQRYRVEHDGERWRLQDSRLPSAFLKIPVRQDEHGNWVADSPLHWDQGLPDVSALIRDNPAQVPASPGHWHDTEHLQIDERHFLRLGTCTAAVRPSLVPGWWRLALSSGNPETGLTITLRRDNGVWQARARQTGRSSAWHPLAADLQSSLGRRASSR